MGETLEFLLDSRGVSRDLGAHIIAACFDDAGTLCFGLGDGIAHLVADQGRDWQPVEILDGAILALAPDAAPAGFICGDDGGSFTRISPAGTAAKIAHYPGKWVEHVARFGDSSSGFTACSVGKKLHLFSPAGAALKTLDHPSTVTGMAFDAKGKRIAASHYNGASLWFTASKTDNPRKLEWKGSHTAIALHPGGEALVTAMQENELHGWRLADSHHMRMSGYPAKTESLSFTRTGKYLATSGADAVVLWPFFGGGPMGKAPTEIAGGAGILCTRVACHPKHDLCAAGFADGAVVLADLTSSRLIPIAPPGHGAVTALAWNHPGTALALGTDSGFAAVVALA